MITESHIRTLAESGLESPDHFIVSLQVKSGNKIMIQLDGDKGVTVKDCVRLSRAIESQLDRDVEDFALEVSSPGIDQPLKMERQYRKNIGRQMQFHLMEDRYVEGVLKGISEGKLQVEKNLSKKDKKAGVDPQTEIDLNEVKKAIVTISFK